MDSQQATNNAAETSSARGMSAPVVKPNAALPTGLQIRPQGPTAPVPRFPANNQVPTGQRPVGPQPIRRLDSRTSLGPPGPGQYQQVRPYGPPRPPGNSFPPRPAYPGQNQPQNFQNPTGTINFPHPQNLQNSAGSFGNQNSQNFLPRQGQPFQTIAVRAPTPANRPPFVNNYPQQQQQRQGNDQQNYPRNNLEFKGPVNGQQSQRNNQELLVLNKVQTNNSNTSQQGKLSIGSSNRINVPSNTAKKMADVEKPRSDLQSTVAKKKSEIGENGENDDDDDDDVVVDDEKAEGQNDNDESKLMMNDGKESAVNEQESAITNGKTTPKPLSRPSTVKLQDNENQIRPVTATISNKVESTMKIENTENSDDAKSIKSEDGQVEIALANKFSTESEGIADVSNATNLNTMEGKSNSNSPIPLQTINEKPNSRPATATLSEKERLSSPAKSTEDEQRVNKNSGDVDKPEEQDEESSGKTSPAKNENGIKDSVNNESFTRPSTAKSVDKESTNDTKDKMQEEVKDETEEGVNKENDSSIESTNKSRAATPDEPEKSDEISGEKPSENPARDKVDDKPSNKSPSPEKVPEKVEKSAKSPSSAGSQKLTVPGSLAISPKSPDGVKGYDNGQRRSLSSRSSPSQSPLSSNSPKSPKSPKSQKSPKSPKSPANEAKSPDVEKKKATFAQDAILKKAETSTMGKKNDESDSRTNSSNRNERRPQTPMIQEKSKTVQNGTTGSESTQSNAVSKAPTTNGVESSPSKKTPSKTKENDKRSIAGSPVKSPSKSVKSLPRTPEASPATTCQEKKKLPMNKIQVGAAPSPNLKTVRSKIGSLDNASYKPGGGNVKIENRKLDFSKAQPKIAAKNDKYTPSGGDKKIAQQKLQWNAKSKIGSLDNATYKPGGGDKKIETVKLDFKDKAKPKVGSKDNVKHVPGGGSVKSSATPPKTPQEPANDIQTQKVEIKAESKVGSLDNLKHKPGGGASKTNSNGNTSNDSNQVQSPSKQSRQSSGKTKEMGLDLPHPPPSTPTRARSVTSASSPITPRAVRSGLTKSPDSTMTKNKSADGKKSSRGSKVSTPEEKSTVTSTSPVDNPQDPLPKTPKKINSGRKTSPKGLKLPKLPISPVGHNVIATADSMEHRSKITLPKLIEPTSHTTRVSH